jgi:hypothetical protein
MLSELAGQHQHERMRDADAWRRRRIARAARRVARAERQLAARRGKADRLAAEQMARVPAHAG